MGMVSCVPPLCWYFSFITKSPSSDWDHFEHRPCIYQRTSGAPYHIIEMGRLAWLLLVGHYVACFAWLCGPGPTAHTRYQMTDPPSSQKVASSTAAAVVVGFDPLSYYYYYCCSSNFSADWRQSTSSAHWVMAKHISGQISEPFWWTDCGSTIVSLDIIKWMFFTLNNKYLAIIWRVSSVVYFHVAF